MSTIFVILKVIISLEKIFMNFGVIDFDLADQEREFVRELSRERQLDCVSPIGVQKAQVVCHLLQSSARHFSVIFHHDVADRFDRA